MNNATFKLTEDQFELIHRVFGGTEIIRQQVQTINTGGNVMNDLYPTKCGHFVLVYEYGCVYIDTLEAYESGDYQDRMYNIEVGLGKDTKPPYLPAFDWDEPLEYNSNG